MTSVIRGDDNFDSSSVGGSEPAFEAEVAWGNSASVNHGLGRVPYSYQVVIRCKTAYNGYSVGDETCITSQVDGDGGRTYMTRVNSSTMYMSRDTSNMINTTPNWVSPGSTSYWRVVFKAW